MHATIVDGEELAFGNSLKLQPRAPTKYLLTYVHVKEDSAQSRRLSLPSSVCQQSATHFFVWYGQGTFSVVLLPFVPRLMYAHPSIPQILNGPKSN